MEFNRDVTLMASQWVAMFVVTVGAALIWRGYQAPYIADWFTNGIATECATLKNTFESGGDDRLKIYQSACGN